MLEPQNTVFEQNPLPGEERKPTKSSLSDIALLCISYPRNSKTLPGNKFSSFMTEDYCINELLVIFFHQSV